VQGFPWGLGVRPKVIECEFEDAKTIKLGYSFHDLAQFLIEKNYKVWVSEWHPILRYGIRHDWRKLERYPCEFGGKDAWGNLLAFDCSFDDVAIVSVIQACLKRNRFDQRLARVLGHPGKMFSGIANRAKLLFNSWDL